MSSLLPDISLINEEYFAQAAVSGILKPGIDLLLKASDDQLSPSQLELKRKYKERFGTPENFDEMPDFVSDVIRVYENYWRSVLTELLPSAAAENRLLSHLKDSFLNHAPRSLTNLELPMDRIEQLVVRELEKYGFKSLLGRTKPYRELMIWKTESVKEFKVKLSDDSLHLLVYFMSDFLVSGWLSFATFDNRKTGGWAANHELYCVTSAYDIESEKFKVSFLAHEARQISDFKRFPKLNSIDLEYRAKLTELTLAQTTTLAIFERIRKDASEGSESAHATANRFLFRDITALDPSQEPAKISQSAGILLENHSARLRELGAAITTGLFDKSK